MYLDAANRMIKDPIDYLIESSRRSAKVCIALKLSGCDELLNDADKLKSKIDGVLANKPIEEWETARRSSYREVVTGAPSHKYYLISEDELRTLLPKREGPEIRRIRARPASPAAIEALAGCAEAQAKMGA